MQKDNNIENMDDEDFDEEFMDEEEDQEHQNHFSQQAKLVTFGSLVHLNLEDNFSLYMYGDGLIDSRLKMKKFDSGAHGGHGGGGSHQASTMTQNPGQNAQNANNENDNNNQFTNCIFMILPFGNLSSFQYQKKFLDEIKTMTNTDTLTSDIKRLRDRKFKINQLKNKLEMELGFNQINLKRSCGQKILLINSNFMFLHIDTMKYLSLNMESQENLFIELVDEPNQFCFFKFIPSLQLQLMRNDNFVYEEELFYICSSETICGKRPFLVAEAKDQILDARGKIVENYVQGSIDNRKKWKLNLYQEPNLDPPENESHSYLKCGDTIWMVLSERNCYLSAQRVCDPFLEVVVKKEQELKHQHTQKVDHDEEEDNHLKSQAIKDIGTIGERLSEQLVNTYEKQLLENFTPQFQTVVSENGDTKMILLLDMSTQGLFRIEPQDQFVGGELEWRKPYRIRHIVSQKYLALKPKDLKNLMAGGKSKSRHTAFATQNTGKQSGMGHGKKKDHFRDIGYDLELIHQRDLKDSISLWSFIPIDNLMDKFESKMKIHKDAYFRLENTETKFQLGFSEEQFEKQGNKEFKSPVMHKFSKDVNTFRFRKANFSDKWETNFLTSSIPVFLDIFRSIVYVDQDETEIKRDQKKFPNFDSKFPQILSIIENMSNFLNNKIISNIDCSTEYNSPSYKRQNKFREQTLLGLMAWALVKIFPSKNEWKKIDLKAQDEIVYLELYGTLKGLEKYGIKYEPKSKTTKELQDSEQGQPKDKIMKTAQAHVKKKYALTYKIYQLLKVVCYRNHTNQKYLEKYIPYLTNHLGMGNFVSDAFQSCFSSNYHILNSLHRQNFTQEEMDLGQEGNLFGNHDQKIDNFFKYLVKKLKQHESYSKDDILNLLGTFCLYQNSTIYINQEKIYSSFVENRTIIFTSMLKIHCEKNSIMIEVRERENFEFKFNKYKLEDFQKWKPDMMTYLMSQLILYSSMCANRNYTCGKAFSEMFPQQVLKKYLENNKLNNELKAIISRLLLNIYIDKEPRLIIQKPNLVRIFKRPKNKKITKSNFLTKQLDKVKQLEAVQDTKKAIDKIGDAMEDMIYENGSSSSDYETEDDEKGEDISVNFIRANAKGAEEDLKAIKEIIQKLTQMAHKAIEDEKTKDSNIRSNPQSPRSGANTTRKNKYLDTDAFLENEEDLSAYDKVYNNLNYEIIKMFYTMLKFGMFTSYVGEGSQQLLETIIQYLSFLLEYDHSYFHEINIHNPSLKRKWIENAEIVKKKKNDALGNIGGNITNIANIGGILKKKQDGEDKDEFITKHGNNKQQENTTFMKMYDSLFKLLGNYTNKTYTCKNEETTVEKSIEVKIKLEICKIFDYLIDWREEFYLDKIMKYFQDDFFGRYEDKTQEEILKKEKDLDEQFQELLPDCMFGVGEEVYFPKKKRGFIFTVSESSDLKPQVRNIDVILERPFTEILLISLYFSKDSDLENSLMNLITRSYTQKQKLIKNLDKINLVAAGESDQSYQAISQLISRLKALHSYAQSWLQIIEQNNYNEKAEENLDVTLEQLQLLNQQFVEDPDNPNHLSEQEKNEALFIKQKIFKHLSGYNFILTFLEQGASVLESNYKYFRRQNDECQFSYKTSFIDKIIEVFKMCHSVLCNFCLNNPKAQKTMFKNYKHLLENMNLVNMGQVTFIEKIFTGNKFLINKAHNKKYLLFMLNLIKYHGHHPQFLNIFQIFLENANPDSFHVQKLVLDLLLDPHNLIFLNPFREEEQDDLSKELKHLPFFGEAEEADAYTKVRYKQVFVKIIAQGLICDIGVNYVVKAYNAVNIPQLLDLLLEKTKYYQNGYEDPEINLENRKTICTLFSIYLNKLEKAIDDFWVNSYVFVEIIKEEFNILQQKVEENEMLDYSYARYLLEDFLPMINMYADSFLKDMVLVSIMSLESKEEYKYANKLYEFSMNLINNLELFIDAEDYMNIGTHTAHQVENIQRLAKVFRVEVDPRFIAIQKSIQQFQTRDFKDVDDFFESFIMTQDQINSINPDKLFFSLQYSKQNQLLNVTSMTLTDRNNMLRSQSSTGAGPGAATKSFNEKSYVGSDQPLKQSKKKIQSQHYQTVFQTFKQIFKNNKKVRKNVKDEGRRFVYSILDMEKYIANPKDAKDRELLLGKADIIKKLLQYIGNWREKRSSKSSVIFTLKVLRHIVIRGTPPPVKGEAIKSQEELQKELRSRQNMMDGFKTTHIILRLFWNNPEKDNIYQYYLLNLLISLLNTGNHNIQQSIYYYFIENNESEKFFAQLSEIINEEVQIVKNSNGMETSIGKAGSGQKPVIECALRVLQLFCEGHYTDMQDYLREQTNSKVNYDMITMMVTMLVSFKISNQTQSAVQQCLDTLTEIVQGPCKQNQQKIAHSKFLEFAVDLLREEEKLFAIVKVAEVEGAEAEKAESKSPKKKPSKQQKKNKIAPNALNSPTKTKGKNIEMEQLESDAEDAQAKKQKQPQVKMINKINVHRGYISRIKYKCLITMLSLLEMSEDDIQIVNRIRRTIPLSVLINNLADLYDIYNKKYKGEYPIQLFNRFDNPIDEEKPSTPDDELVIEIGFFLYMLIAILLEATNKQQLDSEQTETWELIKEFTTVEKIQTSESLLNKLFQVAKNLIIQSYTAARQAAEKAKEALMSNEEKQEMLKRQIEEEKRQRKQLKQDAIKFFCRNTIHIEIARNEQLSRVYFPLLPYCKLLQDETKSNFHDNCDYSNSKTKLSSIMQSADKIIEILEHEQKLQELYKRSYILPFFANNKTMWEQLAFYTNWVINLIILFSYSDKHYSENEDLSESQNEDILEEIRKEQPRLFFDDEYDWTLRLIRGLGYANLVLSGLVVSIFFLQKAPLLLTGMWKEWWEQQSGKLLKFVMGIVTFFKSIYVCLTDFEFVYYSCYMTLVVLGLYVHPFIFGVLTLDMLRSKTLKSVVKAIWIPKTVMALTFLLFLIVTYWFTIFAYLLYQDNFEEQICDKLSICFLRVFDYMFKEGGGVGSFMSHPDLESYKVPLGEEDFYVFKPLVEYGPEVDGVREVLAITEVINYSYLGRFFYDFIVLFVLVILIMNMVAGIMIDTFKALQEEQQSIDESLNQYCFICNIEREKLDKAYDLSNGFFQHIKSDHYLWNYIFFKAYILFKDKTEYTGNETYVVECLKTLDVSWFPIKKAIAVKDEEEAEDQEKKDIVIRLISKMDNLNEQSTTLNQKAKNLLEYL